MKEKGKHPYMLVRWENSYPECIQGTTFEEVRKKAEADERTKQGIPYVIVEEEWERMKKGTA